MRFVKFLGAGFAAACAIAPLSGALAQGDAQQGPRPGYLAMAPSTPQCPGMIWHIQRATGSPNGLAGVVWFDDMSGISVAKGALGADGKLALTLTSVSGAGPVGNVTGTRSPDGTALHASLDGPGCSKLNLLRMPVQNLSQSGLGG